MLNIRVFALVALATFGVAALLRALGPSWIVGSDAAPMFAQKTAAGSVAEAPPAEAPPAQSLSAPPLVERSSVGEAASAELASEVADRAEQAAQSSASQPARSGASRASHRHSRSRAVLMRAAAPPSGGLQAEQHQLELVQKALEKGRGVAAARALDEYGAILPSGELGLEAELLRIDVALARGERDRALELARAFDSRPGAARYKERLAALMGSAAREAPQTALMGSR